MMKTVVTADLAAEIAEGWRGGRYVVYPGNEEENLGDHAIWRTSWRSPDDAKAFCNGIQKSLLFRYTIPFQENFLQDEDLIIDEVGRHIRVRRSADGKTVQIVNTTGEAFAAALEAKFGKP